MEVVKRSVLASGIAIQTTKSDNLVPWLLTFSSKEGLLRTCVIFIDSNRSLIVFLEIMLGSIAV